MKSFASRTRKWLQVLAGLVASCLSIVAGAAAYAAPASVPVTGKGTSFATAPADITTAGTAFNQQLTADTAVFDNGPTAWASSQHQADAATTCGDCASVTLVRVTTMQVSGTATAVLNHGATGKLAAAPPGTNADYFATVAGIALGISNGTTA